MEESSRDRNQRRDKVSIRDHKCDKESGDRVIHTLTRVVVYLLDGAHTRAVVYMLGGGLTRAVVYMLAGALTCAFVYLLAGALTRAVYMLTE